MNICHPELSNRSPDALLHFWSHVVARKDLECVDSVPRGRTVGQESRKWTPVTVAHSHLVESEMLEGGEDLAIHIGGLIWECDMKGCPLEAQCPYIRKFGRHFLRGRGVATYPE